MKVERWHREAALKLLYEGPMRSELEWRDSGVQPDDSHAGIRRAARVAEALAKAEADAGAPWKALREWCSLVPGFRAVTMDEQELVASDMDEENGGSRLVEAPTAAELCRRLGIEALKAFEAKEST